MIWSLFSRLLKDGDLAHLCRHRIANGWPLLRCFFKRKCVARRRNHAEMGPETRNAIRSDTASINLVFKKTLLTYFPPKMLEFTLSLYGYIFADILEPQTRSASNDVPWVPASILALNSLYLSWWPNLTKISLAKPKNVVCVWLDKRRESAIYTHECMASNSGHWFGCYITQIPTLQCFWLTWWFSWEPCVKSS